jgi:hypothetical protein
MLSGDPTMHKLWSNWKLMWRGPALYVWIVFSNWMLLGCIYENDFSLMEWDWFVFVNTFTFIILPIAVTTDGDDN